MIVSEVQRVIIDAIVGDRAHVRVIEFDYGITIDIGDFVSVRLYEFDIRVSDYRALDCITMRFDYCQFDELLGYVNEIV